MGCGGAPHPKIFWYFLQIFWHRTSLVFFLNLFQRGHFLGIHSSNLDTTCWLQFRHSNPWSWVSNQWKLGNQRFFRVLGGRSLEVYWGIQSSKQKISEVSLSKLAYLGRFVFFFWPLNKLPQKGGMGLRNFHSMRMLEPYWVREASRLPKSKVVSFKMWSRCLVKSCDLTSRVVSYYTPWN